MTQMGILYVVATPIGNLSDISNRAIQVLDSVDFIAAEDTRNTKILLERLGSDTSIRSYHEFSDADEDDRIVQLIMQGQSVALVSDAGTPLISDPGYKLVRLARAKGISIIPIPGASSVTAALSVSGLPTDRFLFDGFIPSKQAAKKKYFHDLFLERRTVVVFESTHRIEDSLISLSQIFPKNRQLFVGREITKKFESHFLGPAGECLVWLRSNSNQKKGEFVLVIGGCEASLVADRQHRDALLLVDKLINFMSTKDAVRIANEITGAKKNALYDAVLAKK